MTQPCTSPTVFGQQCSEKFVTVLAGRPLGGQLQLSTPTHSPENPCVASTPAMEVVVHAPSSTPRAPVSASKYVTVSLEKDKPQLANCHSFDVPKTLAECNRQLFTVKQGIGGLVAISSPATSYSKHGMLYCTTHHVNVYLNVFLQSLACRVRQSMPATVSPVPVTACRLFSHHLPVIPHPSLQTYLMIHC